MKPLGVPLLIGLVLFSSAAQDVRAQNVSPQPDPSSETEQARQWLERAQQSLRESEARRQQGKEERERQQREPQPKRNRFIDDDIGVDFD